MQLLVTIDVEGGSAPDRYGCVGDTASVLDRLDVPVTLFVTPDVVQHRPRLIEEWAHADHTVGLHVHPSRLDAGRDSGTDSADGEGGVDFLTTYDRREIDRLVGESLDVVEAELGMRPTTFRAGRWEHSERLVSVLGERGFTHDASLRPSGRREPFRSHGVIEVPMTVYSNRLLTVALRPWGFDTVTLHADAFLAKRPAIVPFYAVTWRLSYTDRPYLMVSIHDYDLGSDPLRSRIVAYLRRLTDRLPAATVDEISVPDDPQQ